MQVQPVVVEHVGALKSARYFSWSLTLMAVVGQHDMHGSPVRISTQSEAETQLWS
jgi:hypothetical protein